MLKKEVTYENFDGEEETETLYFNLSKVDLADMQLEQDGGMQAYLMKIVESKNEKDIWEAFKKIVLAAYGLRDGKRFIKNEEVSLEFSQTLAFDKVMFDIVDSSEAMAEFVKGIVPSDMQEGIEAAIAEGTPEQKTTAQIAAEVEAMRNQGAGMLETHPDASAVTLPSIAEGTAPLTTD